MEYKTIIVEKEANVASVVLNRPDKLNAINTDMIAELTHASEEIRQDTSTHVVVLSGAGRGFCSGGDLSMDVYSTTDPKDLYHFMDTVSKMAMGFRSMPQPVICAVNGVAAGGGANLALACDMIVASDTAKFSQIFVKGNLHPDTGGTYFLPRLVGTAKALELMLTGCMVEAKEALQLGMVNHVVPVDQLMETAMNLARTIAGASPVTTRMIKSSVYKGEKSDLGSALENEARSQIMIMTSGMFQEALKKNG